MSLKAPYSGQRSLKGAASIKGAENQKTVWLPPIKVVHPGTLLLFYSTLMSLAPISPWCAIIVLVCTVCMEMTLLALLQIVLLLKYLLHRSTTYTNVTQSSREAQRTQLVLKELINLFGKLCDCHG